MHDNNVRGGAFMKPARFMSNQLRCDQVAMLFLSDCCARGVINTMHVAHAAVQRPRVLQGWA